MAAAIASRTNRVAIKLSVVLASLAHPIHLAEDLAVADLLSGGRLQVTLGAGYRKEEFRAFQVDWRRRPSLMVEAVATLRKAWSGEEFDFRGSTVRVLPRPARPGGPPLALAGSSEGSARRAAALDLAYEPVGEHFYEVYLEELVRLGKPLPPSRPGAELAVLPRYIAVSLDPDRYWASVGRYVLHNANEYAGYTRRTDLTPFKAASDPDELVRRGEARVYTPDQLVQACHEIGPDGAVNFDPLDGGIPPQLGWESLTAFEQEVWPRLRGQVGSAGSIRV